MRAFAHEWDGNAQVAHSHCECPIHTCFWRMSGRSGTLKPSLLLALHVLEGVHPGVHHIIEREPLLDLAVGKRVAILLAIRDPFAFHVVELKAF